MRLALIKDGIVENVIVSDAAPEWEAIGYIVVESDVAGPGDSWDGATFTPAPPPPKSIPAEVTARQFKMALSRAGLRVSVEAMVEAGDQDLKDWYRESLHFERNNQVLLISASAMGQDAAAIDALFSLAATL